MNNNPNNNKEIEDFFKEFDKISDDFNKSGSADSDSAKEEAFKEISREYTKTKRTRSARHSGKKKNTFQTVLENISIKLSALFHKGAENFVDEETQKTDMGKTTRRKKKKYRLNFKKLFKFIVLIGFICCLAVGLWVGSIVTKAPKINPDNIYSMLAESSVIYDNQGNIISHVGNAQLTRTIIEYENLPDNLVNAFIAIEDKTFWEHSGFNIIRIFGAIKDAVFTGNDIGGTSTITQQLARNVFLTEKMSERSLNRKITEAYYTVHIEKELTKEQIIEAYLNTINLGFNSYGVQAASQAYFSKDVHELDLIECAALSALPKSPSAYALIKTLTPDQVVEDEHVIIAENDDYVYVYNGDISEGRRNQALYNMQEQGLISAEEYELAKADDLLNHINPNMSSITELSSYFADYATEQVINDLAEENGIEYSEAKEMVYNGGFKIYTTLDTNIQKIVEEEYSNTENFPGVSGLKKDGAGNIISESGKLLMYSIDTYFDEEDNFVFKEGEYEWLENGDLKINKGHRLNIYRTMVQGAEDISIEFKSLYTVDENKIFYNIAGGYISIPQEYKTRDDNGNAIISAEYFALEGDNAQKTLLFDENGNLYVDKHHYSLKAKVIQPQSAMVITDYHTGEIKAMVGGRNTSGRLLFNRATSTRQPGSSLKPICVYAPALQQSVDALNGGTTPTYMTYDNYGNPVSNLYGTFMTAASVIDDAPLIVDEALWPKNWYEGYRGLYTLRQSVEQSVNVNAVKVFEQVGTDYAAAFAKKLGITSIVESGETNDMNAAALALGGMTNGASPLELASAYGTFANSGTYVEPIAYTKVTNQRDEVILEKVPRTEKAMDEGVAFIMTDILRTTVSQGIAGKAAIGTQPVAGKTGTTNDNCDAWFVGCTPQYAASVWIGNDINIELSQGSAASAKLWSTVMKRVCEGIPAGSFPSAPSNVVSVTVDIKSGLIPTEISSYDDRNTVRSEYFIKGTQPVESDFVHTYVNICSETGYLATPYCMMTEYKFGVQRPYPAALEVGDIAYEVPHCYCNLHNPDVNLYPTYDMVYPAGPITGEAITMPVIPTIPGTTTTPGVSTAPGTTTTPGWLNPDTPDTPQVPDATDIPIVDTPVVPPVEETPETQTPSEVPDWLVSE